MLRVSSAKGLLVVFLEISYDGGGIERESPDGGANAGHDTE